MITLYHAPQSRSSRIVWLLEEIGAPYEIRPVSIYRPITGQGVPDPANPHPDKRVPALLHNDALVTESVGIVQYLAEMFPDAGLAPAIGDARRGEYLTWLAWYSAEMEAAMFAALSGELAASPGKQRQHQAVLLRLETALAQGPYVMGESFSGADLLIGSALNFGRRAFPESDLLDAYAARCKARDAAIRAAGRDEASGLQAA
jgi:glutathione S-transferase